MAINVFLIFKRITLKACKGVLFFSSSAVAVYLITDYPLVRQYLTYIYPRIYSEFCHNSIQGILFVLLTSVFLFVACVLIDKLRIVIFIIIKKYFVRFLKSMNVINKIKEHVSSFNDVRRCSNIVVAFKTEILSVFIMDLHKKQHLIQETKLKYLKQQYGDLVEKYSGKKKILDRQPIIWIMWWQGYSNMPPIVKACYESVKKHISENVKVILLTKDNYSDYVDIPDYIIDKVEKKIISLTHLSDIIRMACIADNGGIWLDSTIYVTKNIPDELLTNDFFSLSTKEDCHYVSMCKWCGFAIGGRSIVFDFMKDLFYTHWHKYDSFIDFFFIDYGLRMFYDSSMSFREMVDEYSIYTEDLYVLQDNLNEIFDEKTMKKRIEPSLFCKLSWKGTVLSSINGKETFYKHLISK